jgi:hypothetical protein
MGASALTTSEEEKEIDLRLVLGRTWFFSLWRLKTDAGRRELKEALFGRWEQGSYTAWKGQAREELFHWASQTRIITNGPQSSGSFWQPALCFSFSITRASLSSHTSTQVSETPGAIAGWACRREGRSCVQWRRMESWNGWRRCLGQKPRPKG